MKRIIAILIAIALMINLAACKPLEQATDNNGSIEDGPGASIVGESEQENVDSTSLPNDLNDITEVTQVTTQNSIRNLPLNKRKSIVAGTNCIYILKDDGKVCKWKLPTHEGTTPEFIDLVDDKVVESLFIRQSSAWDENPDVFCLCSNGDFINVETYKNENKRESPCEAMDTGGEYIVEFASMSEHVLFLLSDGSLWGYGKSDEGAIELGKSYQPTIEEPLKIMDDIVSVSTGADHTLAIKSDGSLWGWGDNSYGQLSPGTHTKSSAFVKPVELMTDVVFAYATERYSFAITSEGNLYGWGSTFTRKEKNMASLGFEENVVQPNLIMESVKKITGIIYPPYTAYVLRTNGTLWAYGEGWLGDGEYAAEFKDPIEVMDDVADIVSFQNLNVAVKSDGSVWWWGIYEADGERIEQLSPAFLMDGAMTP